MTNIASEAALVCRYLLLNENVLAVDASKSVPPSLADFQKFKYNLEINKHNGARILAKDFTECFERFLSEHRLVEVGRREGVVLRQVHCVVEQWPFRVKRGDSLRDFELAKATGRSSKRYGEWEV